MLQAESLIERNGTLFQVLATFVALPLAWWLGTRSKRSKTFDYRVLSDITIVASHRRPERLSVHFGSREVKNPFITEIEFRNTGTGAIPKADFLEPIQIARPAAEILDWAIIEQSQKALVLHSSRVVPIDGQPEPEYIEIQPETMNKQDFFVVQIVYDGDPAEPPMVSCRILNESRPIQTFRQKEKRTPKSLALSISSGAAAISVGAGTFYLLTGMGTRPDWLIPASGGIAFALLLAFFVSYVQRD
ncbi:hypothetical protein [Arthrobacter sp. SLBN-53]|uniref:hypothetical protein n=1 Tax=Arthrobacter sp. SLBN-53 TaxID=2768412 RepID=UPI001152064B|nr:hypothetical protein [Arthrobacter sp. SLBN-53]TQK27968.1 hypothetical protein FBY28_0934 [Arthrobacter sp. SLBN-53]